jgi:hypothetical protein
MKTSSHGRLLGLLLLSSLLALSSAGCAKRQGYKVGWLYSETLHKRLDAHWFAREIRDGSGVAAVELMYCPSMPGKPTICRTSVVWERDARSLLDHPRIGPPIPPRNR